MKVFVSERLSQRQSPGREGEELGEQGVVDPLGELMA